MNDHRILLEESGRVYLVPMVNERVKIKGLGVFNPVDSIGEKANGESFELGQKTLTILPARLPEIVRGMRRRAQTIGDKDSGVFIAKLGIGPGDTVLEAGLGSAGLGLHIARVLGASGHHITVEPREEHAVVGLENLKVAAECFPETPIHHHIEGFVEDVAFEIAANLDSKEGEGLDAVILDMPVHAPAIAAVAPLMSVGARMACYCPVTSQVEDAWQAMEDVGLTIDWCGEIIERAWGRAAKGGMRPVNGPFGHTAFLVIGQRIN